MTHSFAIKNSQRIRAVAHVLLVLLLLLAVQLGSLQACDVCGCGTGNYSMGMLSQVETNFVGVRYRTMSFDSHLLYAEHLRTKETFKITELWARYSPVERLQITGVLPYQFNSQLVDEGEKEQRGVGDILLLGQYTLYSSDAPDCEASAWKHRLSAGGGVKLPTGRYSYEELGEEGVANANFQLGTGSTDILLAGTYTLQLDAFAAHTEVNYRINTANSRNYRFGNRLNGALAATYTIPAGESFTVAPGLGLYAEWSDQDTRSSVAVVETGGTLFAATAGADVYIARAVVVGAKLYIPIDQDLAGGQIRTHNRLSVQLAWLW